MDTPTICDELMELQRQRRFLIKSINRSTNAAGAFARRSLGWQPNMTEKEKKPIAAKAAAIVKAALDGEIKGDDPDLAVFIIESLGGVPHLEKKRHEIELQMRRLTRKLPVWNAWAKDVRGLGDLGMGVIVAEAGNLSDYGTVSRLWKRLGLAVMSRKDGKMVRQGGLPRTAKAEEWVEHGYSPQRRAQIYACVQEPMIKLASDQYRGFYESKKAEYLARPEIESKAHAHNAAARYMLKKLLRDLWAAWRAAEGQTLNENQVALATAA